MLDTAQDFVLGNVAAVGDLTSTTITYTKAGKNDFPTPLAGVYNPDVGYNVVVFLTSKGSPDNDPNAYIFRVTSVNTGTGVLTGYLPGPPILQVAQTLATAAGAYTVIMAPTSKLTFDLIHVLSQNGLSASRHGFSTDTFRGFGTSSTGSTPFEIVQNGTWTLNYSSIATHLAWQSSATANKGTQIVETFSPLTSTLVSSLFNPFIFKCLVAPNAFIGTNLLAVFGFGQYPPSGNMGLYAHGGTIPQVSFRIDQGVSNHLFAVCNNGTTETAVDTGVACPASATTFHELEIIAITTDAWFYIDGVQVAHITTDIPTADLEAMAGGYNLAATNEGFILDTLGYSGPR